MISFPNQSRVFDATRRAVQFWGHESAMEWSFFVTEDALKRLQPNAPRNEAGLLLAFDGPTGFIWRRDCVCRIIVDNDGINLLVIRVKVVTEVHAEPTAQFTRVDPPPRPALKRLVWQPQ